MNDLLQLLGMEEGTTSSPRKRSVFPGAHGSLFETNWYNMHQQYVTHPDFMLSNIKLAAYLERKLDERSQLESGQRMSCITMEYNMRFRQDFLPRV